MSECPCSYQLDATAPKVLIKSQRPDEDKQCATTETLRSQVVSDWYPGILPVAPEELLDQESMVPSSVSISLFAEIYLYPKLWFYMNNTPMSALFQNSTTSTVLSRETPVQKVELVGFSTQSCEELKIGDVICVQSQESDGHPDNKVLQQVIVEDVTDCTPPGIPLCSKIVPCIEDEDSDDLLSPRKTETENSTPESECEVNIFPLELELMFYENVFSGLLSFHLVFTGCES